MGILAVITGIGIVAAICFILGLALVIVEMFHPGIAAPGIIGGILIIVGLVLAAKSVLDLIVLLILILAILGIALTAVVHSATKGHLSRTLVLTDSLRSDMVRNSSDDMEYFVGKKGVALTPLHPSGTGDFDGVRLDVITDGEFIPQSSNIAVARMDGRKIVVKEDMEDRDLKEEMEDRDS